MRAVLQLISELDAGVVRTPSSDTAAALTAEGVTAEPIDLWAAEPASVQTLVLTDDELSGAGDRAEGLIDQAAHVLVGNGALIVTAVADAVSHRGRAFSAAELTLALNHRGFTVTHAPVRAGVRHAAAARAPADEHERSRVFFATLPRKVIAASTVCISSAGRMLIVFDSFRSHWTNPGGVVDPDESPQAAAQRETWEEAGVKVEVGELLGVFHYTQPDRLLMLYAATADGEPSPQPVHTHEVAEAKWLPLKEALATVNPRRAEELKTVLNL